MQAARRRSTARKIPISDDALAAELGGRCTEPGLIVIESTLEPGICHGQVPVSRHALAKALEFFTPGIDCDPGAVAYMDTETSGLAGGTGTMVFLLGLARYEGEELRRVQFLLTRFAGEVAMLERARAWMQSVQTLVTFNGKSFDAPLLASRHRLNGLPDPFAGLAHLDLLYPVRRAFAGRWPDCRLATAEERLLAFRRVGDLPGAEAPQAWFSWLRCGCAARLPAVIEHNRIDLTSLTALLPCLSACYEDPIAWGADPCAALRASAGGEESVYRYLIENRYRLADDALLELGRLARRRADWSLAVGIWRELAAIENVEAIERLAKYHEHIERSFERAWELTRALIELEPFSERHHHRARRLRSKLAGC